MRSRAFVLTAGFSALSMGLVLLFLVVGDVSLAPAQWWDAVSKPGSIAAEIVWGIRLPRTLCAAGVGAMLGLSGALLQGLLRNPLAEPGILGVSAGAGLGASLCIVAGLALVPFAVESLALAGAVGVAALLMGFVSRFPHRLALILLGVGLTSLGGALMSLVFNLSPSPVATAEILNWMMGSVDNRNWADVGVAVAGLAIVGLLSVRFCSGLRYLTLGEETARSMGVDMVRLNQMIILGSSLLAGLSVAIAGIVGFVGLAAPHLARALGVKDPYALLWPSAAAGGLMVLLADGLIRVLPITGDIRLGVVTSVIGAPLFALIAWRSARSWVSDT